MCYIHVHFPLQWVPEITRHCPNAPFLLVGLQIDLREDKSLETEKQLVTADAGKKLARKLGALKYVECSALTQEGLRNVIQEGYLAAVNKAKAERPNPQAGLTSLFRLPNPFKST